MRKSLLLTKSDVLLQKGKPNDKICMPTSQCFYTEDCLQCEQE